MSDVQKPLQRPHWHTAPELPEEVFAKCHKPNGEIGPVAVIATVKPDGTPHIVVFGRVCAVTPRLLRATSALQQDTYTNLRRDRRVMVVLLAPPNITVSIQGRARVVSEHRNNSSERSLILMIDIEEVKNERAYKGG